MKFFCYEIFRFRSHYKGKQAFLPNVPVARSGVVNSKSTKSTFLSNVYLAEMNYPLTLMLTFIYILHFLSLFISENRGNYLPFTLKPTHTTTNETTCFAHTEFAPRLLQTDRSKFDPSSRFDPTVELYPFG